MFKMYHNTLTDSTLNPTIRLHRKRLLRYLDGPFIPEISYQLDAVDSLLDAGRVAR